MEQQAEDDSSGDSVVMYALYTFSSRKVAIGSLIAD